MPGATRACVSAEARSERGRAGPLGPLPVAPCHAAAAAQASRVRDRPGAVCGRRIDGLVRALAGAQRPEQDGGSYALQAGGVETGDLETGSVVGQPFKELSVDVSFFAVEIGNMKIWYPPMTVIDFKSRPGAPVLLKVTNNATAEHGFQLSAVVNQSAPTALHSKIVLKPGETQYIGVPTSDLFYSGGNVLEYRCHLHPGHVGGKLLMLK